MATKITKSELKQMIREALREELSKQKLTEAAKQVNVPAMCALYEDDDGYVCKTAVYAADLDEEELEEVLSEAGMMYITVWEIDDYTVSTIEAARLNPGDILEVFDVEDEDIEEVAAIAGKDPEEYKHVGFFESRQRKRRVRKSSK